MKSFVERIAKSKWMQYKIIVGDDVIHLNLTKELRIDEDNLTAEMVEHPRIFAYIARIHKHFVREAKLADLDRKKLRSKLVDHFIQKGDAVNKAKEKVESHNKYVKAYQTMIEHEYNRDTLESILESYKQRKDLIQTLSANLRTEK